MADQEVSAKEDMEQIEESVTEEQPRITEKQFVEKNIKNPHEAKIDVRQITDVNFRVNFYQKGNNEDYGLVTSYYEIVDSKFIKVVKGEDGDWALEDHTI